MVGKKIVTITKSISIITRSKKKIPIKNNNTAQIAVDAKAGERGVDCLNRRQNSNNYGAISDLRQFVKK